MKEPCYLKSTGTAKGFEPEIYDNYIITETKEGHDFEFMTEEMWQFVNSRYGSDTPIKRLYQKSKYSYYSEVELRLKSIPVVICTSQKLLKGHYSDANF